MPGITFLFLCITYYELERFISDIKLRISTIIRYGVGARQLDECANLLCKSSEIVRKLDKVFSPLMFYLIGSFIIQIMVLITLSVQQLENIYKAVSATLGFGVISGLVVIVEFASQIPKRYKEIKTIIVTSACLRKELFSGKPDDIGFAGLSQIMNELNSTFYMTVMGVVKIEKSLIITLLCALISYGIVLYQVIGI